ncbi:MAG: zinc ABC transporter substrate-binding protein [Lacipirellulaceae bacterium]
MLTLLTGCSGGDAEKTGHDHNETSASVGQTYSGEYPIQALATIGQVAEMVERVGGEHIEVKQLMGPGVDPHLFRPVASDTKALRDAEAIFYSGLHLEGRLTDLFVQLARKKLTYAVTIGLLTNEDERLREPPEFDGMHDPHVWHDVAIWSQCVEDLADELATYDPKHAEDYKANAAKYRAELAELDSYVKQQMQTIPEERRVLVTAHDAFGYLGKAYGIEVYGLKGISSELEKDLEHQEEIQAMLIEKQIPAVFVESAIAPRTIEALVEPCRAAGLDLQIGGTLYADVLGEKGTDAGTYAGMIRHNVDTIVTALTRDATLSEE